MKNRIEKCNENDKHASKLREDLKAKQNEIRELQEDMSLLKRENVHYVKRIKEMNSLLVAAQQSQKEGAENQENCFKEKVRLLEQSYKDACVEKEKLCQENRRLEAKTEDLKREAEQARDNEQLKIVMKHFEESQEKVSKMEKLCIQQRFEISELDDVVENFRQNVLDQQKAMDGLIIDNNNLKEDNMRLVAAEVKLKELMDEEMERNKDLTCRHFQLESLLKQIDNGTMPVILNSNKKEGVKELPVEAKELKNFYEAQFDELSKTQAELNDQVKIRDERIKEYEKRFELMVNEMKALRDLGFGDEGYLKPRGIAEKLAESGKYRNIEDGSALDAGSGTEIVQNFERAGQLRSDKTSRNTINLKQSAELTLNTGQGNENKEPDSLQKGERSMEFTKNIACLQNKVDWLAELCMQCKYQNDYIKGTLETLVPANENDESKNHDADDGQCKKASMTSNANVGIIKDKFETLEKQIERYQIAHEREASSMQQEWTSLQQSLQKLTEINTILSERINRVQSEVATIRKVGSIPLNDFDCINLKRNNQTKTKQGILYSYSIRSPFSLSPSL